MAHGAAKETLYSSIKIRMYLIFLNLIQELTNTGTPTQRSLASLIYSTVRSLPSFPFSHNPFATTGITSCG